MSDSKSEPKEEYPKYESHCCGAPVKVLEHTAIKYFCEECGEKCIARKKK